MIAARFYKPGDIRLDKGEVPSLPPGGALLKVLACGVCGTDKRIFKNGHFHIATGEPRILGHEIIAEIQELDHSIDGYQVGQRVTVAPNIGCGICQICLKGYTQLCDDYDAFGISLDGGFAEYMAVPAVAVQQGNMIPVPDSFSVAMGSMIEINACSFRGLSACRPEPGNSILIIGGGAVTYLMSHWARNFKASKVLVSVIDDGWGELSKKSQPDVIINSRKEDLASRVFEETGGRGADVVMVACSAKDMDEIAPDLAAKQGRVNFFGGLPAEDAFVKIDSRKIHYREVTITGTTGANVYWIKKSLSTFLEKPFDLEGGITDQIPLESIVSVFHESPSVPRLKTIITCS